MINKRDFYKQDKIPAGAKGRVWNRIDAEFNRKKSTSVFSLWSYALGAVSVLVFYFFSLGIMSVISRGNESRFPEDIRINNAYVSAISELEQFALPNKDGQEVEVDELMKPRLEKINALNHAIAEFGDRSSIVKYEPVKEERLRALYALKLQTLQELIDLEGKSNEKN